MNTEDGRNANDERPVDDTPQYERIGRGLQVTNDQAEVIAVKLDHLISDFKDMKEQNERDHQEVKTELATLNTRLTTLEMWRERIKGALFSVPALVSLATSIVGGIVLYVLTNS